MTAAPLKGVIAAIPTPLDAGGSPDLQLFLALAQDLLNDGCDALNVLGTTGEATSFSVAERIRVMEFAAANLPKSRLMVGTGAASLADAVVLTEAAGRLGFGGALLLPPFYYKNVPTTGIITYLAQVAAASSDSNLPLYLYNFPAMSGIAYTPDVVAEALSVLGTRLAGIKDSSGDLPYCRTVAGISRSLSVFPATEAALIEARSGIFAGCISASANVNADLCAKAFHKGDEEAAKVAVSIRALFSGMNIVSGVKGMLASLHSKPGLARMRAPLVDCPIEVADELAAKARALRAGLMASA